MTSAALLFVTRRVLLLAAWCCVGCLALAALLRIAAFDRTRFGTLIDATTLWVFIPAWVILVVAVIARRHGLAATAGVIVALHLLWVAPPLLHRSAIPAVARHAPRLRVVTANLRFDNADQVPLARELADSGADVLVLQEVTARWWASLDDAGVLERYPHEAHILHHDAGGAAILTRLPLSDATTVDIDGWPLLAITVTVHGNAVRVFDVHPVPPAYLFDRHRRMVREITTTLRDALPSGPPAVVTGDFNATPYNKWLHTLAGLGLRSAHEERGRPFATTWPNGRHFVPPERLDHVLHTRELVAVAIREGQGHGSDHRPVIADLAVP